MRTYLAEGYMPRAAGEELKETVARLAAACAAVSRPQRPVRHLRALHVPGDELCLHLFEAASSDAVTEAATLAGIRHMRVVEAVPAAQQANGQP